jgi:acetyltransferase-like isoleucine patch superfamily enzyme
MEINMDIFIHESTEIEKSVKIGEGSKIWHNAQIREGSEIGKNCSVGKGVYIDHNVKIGNNVKIQNYVSVYNGVTIEDDVLLAPNCTFTNDLYPRAFNQDWKVTPTLVKKGASIGANATILCGVTIGEYSMIGIGSTVTNDTLPHSLMVGNPARLKNFICQCGSELQNINYSNYKIQFQCPKCANYFHIDFSFSKFRE